MALTPTRVRAVAVIVLLPNPRIQEGIATPGGAAAGHGFEYRLGLIQERVRTHSYRAISGEYVGEWQWKDDVPVAEALCYDDELAPSLKVTESSGLLCKGNP